MYNIYSKKYLSLFIRIFSLLNYLAKDKVHFCSYPPSWMPPSVGCKINQGYSSRLRCWNPSTSWGKPRKKSVQHSLLFMVDLQNWENASTPRTISDICVYIHIRHIYIARDNRLVLPGAKFKFVSLNSSKG